MPKPRDPSAAGVARSVPDYVEGIDIEDLHFFLTLHEAGSLPKAAEHLGVSLSSANRMLARLRAYWDEPLFERSGFRMQPTAGAKRRFAKVREIMRLLEDLRREGEIDPASLVRTVRIGCYDNAFACAVAANYAAFVERLPNVTLQVTQADENLFNDLRHDRLDMVFFAHQGVEPDIRSIPVLTTPYVCVVSRPDHPLALKAAERPGGLTRYDLAAHRQVLVNAQPDRYRRPNSPAGGWFNPPETSSIGLVTPFFLSVPTAIAGTDHYAIVPELTARVAFKGLPVTLLRVTPAAPKLTIRLGWHEHSENDVAGQFIRAVLVDLIRKRSERFLQSNGDQT